MAKRINLHHHFWPMESRLFYLLGIALGSKRSGGGSTSEECAIALALGRPDLLPTGLTMEEAKNRIDETQIRWVALIRSSLH